MTTPTLCMIFEAVGPYNAIGKIAASQVRAALDAGYRVSVVAHRLDESLRGKVEWLELYNPPRGFALKWLTARHFIKRALGGRRFDVVHGHQPQIADLCDLFQCHFLTRVAHERGGLVAGTGLMATLRRWQQQAVMLAEDRCYRRWNPATRMLFVSELVRREFERLYGLPARWSVLENSAPAWDPVSENERRAARAAFGLSEERRPIVGYLGGLQVRKGYKELLSAMATEPGLFLLMGGIHAEGFVDPALAGRMRSVGLTGDVRSFYAVCDVLAVPSRFEPVGLVAWEAAACGLPVIVTPTVGALDRLREHGAGRVWEPSSPLGPVVSETMDQAQEMRAGGRRLCETMSAKRVGRELLTAWARAAEANRESRGPVAIPAEPGVRT